MIHLSLTEWIIILYSPGFPGLLVSLVILWRILPFSAWRWPFLAIWCILAPYLAFWVTFWLSPELAGRSHVYGTMEIKLRAFGPGLILLPGLAFALGLGLKRPARKA